MQQFIYVKVFAHVFILKYLKALFIFLSYTGIKPLRFLRLLTSLRSSHNKYIHQDVTIALITA